MHPVAPDPLVGATSNPSLVEHSNMPSRLLRLGLLALVLGLGLGLSSVAHADLTPDQTARVLAGMDTDAFADSPKHRDLYLDYSKKTAKNWDSYNTKIGAPIEKWARKKLPTHKGETVFYPFAGPDFTTVHRLYPDADRYVLIALQTAGHMPDLANMSDKRLKAVFGLFRDGIGNFAIRGFFHTRKMHEQFEKSPVVEGITGVMLAFAVREGYSVTSVMPIQVSAAGEVEVLDPASPGRNVWDSVRFELDKDGHKVILDYLQLDLSDGNLKKNKPHRDFIRKVSGNRVVLKAASHLMQQQGFATIRDALLERATSIWQDETGLPYTPLAEHFEVDLYGDFSHVNTLFDQEPQRALKRAYETRDDVQNLPFQVGYRKEAGSCLQVAHTRKTKALAP